MKQPHSSISILVLLIPLFLLGMGLQPVFALGKIQGSKSSFPHMSTHQSRISPRLPETRAFRSKSMATQRRHRIPRVSRGKSILGKRHFKHKHHLSPRLFLPPVPFESSERIIIVLPEQVEATEATPEEVARPSKIPHPLIIEERCGEYMRIPWPESGKLDAEGQEESCPESDRLSGTVD